MSWKSPGPGSRQLLVLWRRQRWRWRRRWWWWYWECYSQILHWLWPCFSPSSSTSLTNRPNHHPPRLKLRDWSFGRVWRSCLGECDLLVRLGLPLPSNQHAENICLMSYCCRNWHFLLLNVANIPNGSYNTWLPLVSITFRSIGISEVSYHRLRDWSHHILEYWCSHRLRDQSYHKLRDLSFHRLRDLSHYRLRDWSHHRLRDWCLPVNCFICWFLLQASAGWIGFFSIISGCLGSILVSAFVDRFKRRIKLCLQILCIASIITFAILVSIQEEYIHIPEENTNGNHSTRDNTIVLLLPTSPSTVQNEAISLTFNDQLWYFWNLCSSFRLPQPSHRQYNSAW